MIPFKLNFIDHVAIRAQDMPKSIEWYERVLGLEKKQFEEWGDFPIFMMKASFAVAIFPARLKEGQVKKSFNSTFIDHFAFNVSNKDFKKAQDYFDSIDVRFAFQDHHYTHSIYLKDPDNHTVELTTLVTDPSNFYE
jgi:catechol 2,3-dioxygenase-like lactoylglutathione lyase family enzyme